MGIISNKKVSVAILFRSNHRLTGLYLCTGCILYVVRGDPRYKPLGFLGGHEVYLVDLSWPNQNVPVLDFFYL